MIVGQVQALLVHESSLAPVIPLTGFRPHDPNFSRGPTAEVIPLPIQGSTSAYI